MALLGGTPFFMPFIPKKSPLKFKFIWYFFQMVWKEMFLFVTGQNKI
jgi:hypothetical protein